VAAIAEGLAAVTVPWEMATEESPDERQYELILATESYDAWLIHWPAGSGLGAHDHGGSAGAFAVVSGVLEEQTAVRSDTVTRRVAAGESVCFGADHVHAVFNGSDAAATSVHVYAPPLRSMGFYRADGGTVVLERVDKIGSHHY
jgi:mannose-6-phosphate isomerase-like protein (cupin superfamily)